MKVCTICHARFRGDAELCPFDGGRLEEPPDPLVGRTIGGRYLLQQKIGSGGMGTVYRAVHEVVGRNVAIKFLDRELASDAANRTRFLREARAANRINHENIIDIADYGETDDGLVYLVMEYLDGVSLATEIARGPMPPRRALEIMLQVARALGRAHELGVIHRDIKPDNIHLLRGDFVKVLDFGLAQMKGELRLTATGTVFGTPEYMSPEQVRGQSVSPAADLYAIGCVLFEMLTRRLPFEGSTAELVLQHMRTKPPAPSSIVRGIGPEVDAIVARLLAKELKERYASAYAVAGDIERVLEDLPTDPRLRSHVIRREAPSDEPVTTSFAVEDAWEPRIAVFLELVGRAHPAGAPVWLKGAITSLSSQVRELRTMRASLTDRASRAAVEEESVREARLRIGRALDELGRDDANLARRIAEAEVRVAEEGALLRSDADALRSAWASIGVPPRSDEEVPVERAEALVQAGTIAGRWLEHRRALSRIETELGAWQREREDLRFQLDALKGRLAALTAEKDDSLDRLKAEAGRLDRELHERLDRLVREADAVARHFMQFPDLRDTITVPPTPPSAPDFSRPASRR